MTEPSNIRDDVTRIAKELTTIYKRQSIPSAVGVSYPTAELFHGVLVTQGGWARQWLNLLELKAALKRWVSRSFTTADPRAATDGAWYQCGGCRFVMMFDGDYGLCGNAESPNDGRVVFEHAGCMEHSEHEKWEA